ncbi:MAG TPA: hypothetical protein PLB89_05120 [Flavobacteriales bacterium]|nr:hypothetical protein [Flavobacteriales bacterium]
MANPNRLPKLRQTELDLLEVSARDLIPAISANTELKHVREMAFEYYDKKLEQHYQVHVMVTRDADDFLEPFQTEEMS